MRSFLVLFLVGCTNQGSGEVTTLDHAPWDMNGASAFLFTPASDNNGREGSGIFVISTDPSHQCSDVVNGTPTGGSGLRFDLAYFTGREVGKASPAWDGLYAAGLASDLDSAAFRTLAVGGWYKGFAYSFEGTDAWLDISQGSQDRFIGGFVTEWWRGDFDAEVCEESDVVDVESGMDTGL
jgi:hypothetical protein